MRKLTLTILLSLCSLMCFGQSIPEHMVLKRLDNTEVTMKEAFKDDVVILTFWATWCKPCRAEMEALSDIEDQWKDKVRIVAVSIDDSRAVSKVKSLVKGSKWAFDVLLDVNKDLYKALNISSVPFAMILHKGKIVWTHSGYAPGNELVMVEKALALKQQ